jgi:hypothetical protein
MNERKERIQSEYSETLHLTGQKNIGCAGFQAVTARLSWSGEEKVRCSEVEKVE